MERAFLTILTFLHLWASVNGVAEDPNTCCKMGTLENVGPIWNCIRCGLTRVPPNPPSNAKAVSLEANNIKTIPKGSFRNYKNIAWLKLTNNSLTLEKGSAYFDGLSNLAYLSIARNQICLTNLSEHNPDVFAPLENLRELNLYRIEYNRADDRHFAEYPGEFLAPLKSLRAATLPPVSFKKFGNHFENLTNFFRLAFLASMPGARILWTVMTNETFEHLTTLKTIVFIDSSLKVIESHALRPFQKLSTIEVFCSNLQAIQLLNAIEHLQKPSLKTLIFEYDKSLANVPRNKTFESLGNLSRVIMGIPYAVPHPNPFMLDVLPIFWKSVQILEIIRPYSGVYVDTVYRNPLDKTGSELQITISNTIKHIPYRSACIITSMNTKVNKVWHFHRDSEHHSMPRMIKHWENRQREGQDNVSATNTPESSIIVHSKFDAPTTSYPTSKLLSAPQKVVTQNAKFGGTGDRRLQRIPRDLMDTRSLIHPSCYGKILSSEICYRLLSLTLTFYISYTQSQMFDLVLREGARLEIHTELKNLTVNKFLHDSLPSDTILKNLVEFNIQGAGVHHLIPRTMSDLKIYNISKNHVTDLRKDDPLSRLHGLEVFDASDNGLETINPLSFRYAHNMTQIFLQNNKLRHISLNISHLKHLETIDLNTNWIHYFAEPFMQEIMKQSNVLIDLSNNSLSCACGKELITFISWTKENQRFFKRFESYSCQDLNGESRVIRDLDMAKYRAMCRSKLPIYIAVPMFCSIFSVVLLVLCYQHRWRVMWYAYTLNNCCKRKRKRGKKRTVPSHVHGDLDPLHSTQAEEEYDMFLGYAQDDVQLGSTMAEKIENNLELSIIHPEAFEWGKSVFLQSVNGIKQSNKIVFLVSKDVGQNELCNFQLHMAVIKGIENIIFLEMESKTEIANSDMGPFLRNILGSAETLEYRDNPTFWKIFLGKLGLDTTQDI